MLQVVQSVEQRGLGSQVCLTDHLVGSGDWLFLLDPEAFFLLVTEAAEPKELPRNQGSPSH